MGSLIAKNLAKAYKSRVVVTDVSLAVNTGQIVGLLGPNGAGKSTCIGIISGLVNKSAGSVEILGHDINREFLQARALLGSVPQEFNFNQFEKVYDIVVTQAGYFGLRPAEAKANAEELLKALDLWDKRDTPSRMLSGGMKRRLMIARALVHKPDVLILDEPTAGVDIELRRSMWEFMEELNRKGTTIILTTHYLEEAEANITRSLKEPTGKVRLTAPTTFGSEIIAPLLNDFLMQFPKVEVDFHLTNRMVDLIDEGYDLAIRLGKLADSTMIAKKLTGRFNYVCLSPRYKTDHGEPKCLSELQQHNCLIGSNDCWRFHVDGKDKAVKVSGTLRCNNGYGLLDAALKGIGIVQLPDQYVTPYIESGQLLPVLCEYAEPEQGIWVVYPHNKQLSPKIRLLIDHLSEGITAQETGVLLLQATDNLIP